MRSSRRIFVLLMAVVGLVQPGALSKCALCKKPLALAEKRSLALQASSNQAPV